MFKPSVVCSFIPPFAKPVNGQIVSSDIYSRCWNCGHLWLAHAWEAWSRATKDSNGNTVFVAEPACCQICEVIALIRDEVFVSEMTDDDEDEMLLY
jgi:hypothetical protein